MRNTIFPETPHIPRGTLADWHKQGFMPHPVASPNAMSSGGTPLKGAGKVPALVSGAESGAWRPMPGWPRASAAHFAGFAASMAAGASIGVRTGEGIIAVDCDLMDEAASADFLRYTRATLGDGATRIGRFPKWAMFFRCKDAVPSRDVQGVQLLGAGRQVVVQGIHPVTKQPYRWDRDPLAPGALPTITIKHFERRA